MTPARISAKIPKWHSHAHCHPAAPHRLSSRGLGISGQTDKSDWSMTTTFYFQQSTGQDDSNDIQDYLRGDQLTT